MKRHLIPVLGAALLMPIVAAAQALPNINSLRVRYNTVKTTTRPEGALKAQIDEVDKSLAEAARLGRTGEMRRLYARGLALLNGTAWTDELDFASSVVLRTDRVFADSTKSYAARVEQIYAPALALTASLQARAALRAVPAPPAPGGPLQPGPIVKDLGVFDRVGRDLRESPYPLEIDLSGVADGRYVLQVELVSDGRTLATPRLTIDVRKGLEARLAKLAEAADRLAGAARADVLYPADYMKNVNRGRIEMGAFDPGKEIAAAEAVAAAAKGGKDPFAGRKGDIERHYLLEAAGEIMPYRVYVPASYTGTQPYPLIVALHGLGGNEDAFFDRYDQRVPALAEARGYLVVGVLGFRVDGAYGYGVGNPPPDPAERFKVETSEADVLAVLDLMKKQYRVDERRIFLMGHSMGAIGTWRLAAKYPDKWRALGLFAGLGSAATVERMKHIPQFVVHGDADPTVSVAGSRGMVAEMKKLGVEHKYIEVPGGNHIDVVVPNLEGMFDFFDAHGGKPLSTSTRH